MKIGLMGGTFDPVHFGHLFIAEASRVAMKLDEVWWIPNRKPAHREGKTATLEPEVRADLVRLAIEEHPQFKLSRVELEREGPSFAIDTVSQIQREHPASELFWILGADAMEDFPTWHRADELMQMCRFIACSRPGYDLEAARQVLALEHQARVTWLEVPGLHISSRDLRFRIANNLPIRYLLPDKVRQEIVARKLYESV